jgi:NAD(P)-dependent dehydrogenase (short-subunit alcohol dehydrogenase family)
MQLGLAGKVAIITGGSMGIGKAAALALAQEGPQVVICARGIEALQESAREIRATGTKVLSRPRISPIRLRHTIF